jgi:outer membrane protein OmpA-like peptidoglycan-associated protein
MLRVLGAAIGLMVLTGCMDGPRYVGGRQVASSPCAASTYRSPGPCYNGTDITERRNYDDTRNITPLVPDDRRDITDRTNYDDTTDRTVWCEDVGRVIRAPSFMVFFDWDKSELSPKALETIRRAADAYKTKGGAQVKATGHTDTSGPDDYNMALSLRRANAVKEALVRNGVPATEISVIGRGEKQLLVPTGDGIREAQNRRVEIVLRDGER